MARTFDLYIVAPFVNGMATCVQHVPLVLPIKEERERKRKELCKILKKINEILIDPWLRSFQPNNSLPTYSTFVYETLIINSEKILN